jgi:molybdenum cofactor biosynthesis enzyme MoaA
MYPGIVGDRRQTYQALKKVTPVDNYEQVFDLFLNYVDTVIDRLEFIHCTGGEPTTSPNFWRFMEHVASLDTQHVTLYITTNLSGTDRIKRILEYRHKFKEIRIRASVENIGARAEFVRKGLIWPEFANNLDFLVQQGIYVNINSTLSGVALDGLADCIQYLAQLPTQGILTQSLNKITHPNFQSMSVLPQSLRLTYADQLEQIQNQVDQRLSTEIQSVIYMLRKDHATFDNVPIRILEHSARNFYREYARRHGFDIRQTFSPALADWLLA